MNFDSKKTIKVH